MKAKQIEQAQKSLKWVVNQIPEDLGDSNEEKMLKCIRLYCQNGAEAIGFLKAEKEQIRKETAKDILQELFDKKEFIQDAGSYPVTEARHIIGIANKYGVKID